MTTPASFPDDDASLPALWDAARYLLDWLVNLFESPVAVAALGVLAPRERADILSWLRPLEALVRRLLLVEAAAIAPGLGRARSRHGRYVRARRLWEQNPENSAEWRVSFRVLPQAPQPSGRPHAARPVRGMGERPGAVFNAPCANAFKQKGRNVAAAPMPAPPDERAAVEERVRSAQRLLDRLTGAASRPDEAQHTPAPLPPQPTSDLPNAWPLAERWEAVARVLKDPTPYARRLARRLSAEPARAHQLAKPQRHRTTLGQWALSKALALAGPAALVFDTG